MKSYWVINAKLMAGEYPGSSESLITRCRIRDLLSQGVNRFIDLTEVGEYGLLPYLNELNHEASLAGVNVTYHRFPIPDMSMPTAEEMRRILKVLGDSLKGDDAIYLHCYGGKGRTGTVVGCFLVEQGFSGKEALQQIENLRGERLRQGGSSPETEAQRDMVINWRNADEGGAL